MGLTDALEDVELIVLVEDDLAIPCDIWEDCSTVARWSLRCEGCTDVALACDEHKRVLDARSRDVHVLGIGFLMCAACRHRFPHPMPFLPL